MFKLKLRRPKDMRQVARVSCAVGGLLLVAGLFACLELPDDTLLEEAKYPGGLKDVPIVRVSIRKARTFSVGVEGRFLVQRDDSAAEPIQNSSLAPVQAVARGGTILLGRTAFDARKLTLIPETNGMARVDGERYHGSITLLAQKDAGGREYLRLINNINVEAYLCGVLSGEVPVDRWHEEALKAQAVASRTYALYQMQTRRSADWDVTADQHSQVFLHRVTGSPRANRAVNATRGCVLTWRHKLFPAYFHSSCGGHTEAAANVWKDEPAITPLSGRRCVYCRKPYVTQKFSRWEAVIRHDAAAEALRRMFPKKAKLIRSVRRIEAGKRTEAGQARTFKCYGVPTVEVSAAAFRAHYNAAARALGRSAERDGRMRSLMITRVEPVGRRGRATRVTGSGWGHGAGLCQWGSQGLAKQGRLWDAILRFYYPGAAIVRLPYAATLPGGA